MLKGEKVLLRPRRTDKDSFLKWFNDLEATQYLTIALPMMESEKKKWIENLATERKGIDVIMAIEDEQSNKAIGNCGLHNINRIDQHATFGIAIGEKEYWSKGFGTEATSLMVNYGFEQLNLHRIGSSVYSFNERSLKMHLSLDLKEEGRLRKRRFKNDWCRPVVFYL